MGCKTSKGALTKEQIRTLQMEMSDSPTQKVYLNVYSLITSEAKAASLSRDMLEVLGVGLYHTGVVIFGEEWSFGACLQTGSPDDDGIFAIEPTTAECELRDTLELGTITITREGFTATLDTLRPNFKALSYHLLNHNCNCFSYELVKALGGTPKLIDKFPGYVNRAATSANVVVPDSTLSLLMDALNPPSAMNPHLIGILFIESTDTLPVGTRSMMPTYHPKKSKVETRGCGCFKSVSDSTSAFARATYLSFHSSEFNKAFPLEANQEHLVDVYSLHVRHLNRWQVARLFITKTSLYFHGSNNLAHSIPFTDIDNMTMATMDPASHGKKTLPKFTFPSEDGKGSDKCDSVVLYGKAEVQTEWTDGSVTTDVKTNVIFPLTLFSSKGARFRSTVGKVIERGRQHTLAEEGYGVLYAQWREALESLKKVNSVVSAGGRRRSSVVVMKGGEKE